MKLIVLLYDYKIGIGELASCLLLLCCLCCVTISQQAEFGMTDHDIA